VCVFAWEYSTNNILKISLKQNFPEACAQSVVDNNLPSITHRK